VRMREAIAAGSPIPVPDIQGECLEIEVHIAPGDCERCGLVIRCSPDGEEQTRITYDRKERTLSLDRSQSSLDSLAKREILKGELALADGEDLTLRIFLDYSVVEIFANSRACLTGRIYPSRRDSRGLALFAEGGLAPVRDLRIWSMKTVEVR
jgi:beta-fructofuranosidase